MSKVSCVLLLAALCALSAAVAPDNVDIDIQENFLSKYEDEEVKESSSLIAKCYDEETKSFFKLDSVWYPKGTCEKRVCSRQRDSKTPIIKTMKCEPCNNCKLPQVCQPFKPEKNYPKCCEQCLTKSVILKKQQGTKKYQTV